MYYKKMPSKAKKVVEPTHAPVVQEEAKTVKSKVEEPKKVTKSKSKTPESVQQAVVTPTPEPVVLENVVVKTDTDETAVVDSFSEFLTKFQTSLRFDAGISTIFIK